MERTKREKLKDLCKGHFLNKLFQYFDFQDRDQYYENILISNDINLDCHFISFERKSHEGFKNNIKKISNKKKSLN